MTNDPDHLVQHSEIVFDQLSDIIKIETKLIRQGAFTKATQLQEEKSKLFQQFLAILEKVNVPGTDTGELEQLRPRIKDLHAQLEDNLHVLGLAHTITMDVLQRVNTALNVAEPLSSYTGNGQQNAPSPHHRHGIAIDQGV